MSSKKKISPVSPIDMAAIMKKSKGKKPPPLWSNILTVLLILAVVAAVLFYGLEIKSVDDVLNLLQENWSTKIVPLESNPLKSDKINKKSPKDFPNYEEYIMLAEKNNWHPTDPMEKLNSTIQKFSQIYDLSPTDSTKQFDEYVSMLEQEMTFLFEVFKSSPEHRIDLTAPIFLAIEVAQQSIFRVTKRALGSGQASMVTKMEVSTFATGWVYAPIRSLLRMAAAAGPPNYEYPNIIADFKSRGGRGGYTMLMKAVQYRMHALYSVFGSVCKDSIGDSLEMAIVNGDDLAVALLIKVDSPFGDILRYNSRPMQYFVDLAMSLKYLHVANRLQRCYAQVLVQQAALGGPFTKSTLSSEDAVELAMTADDENENIPTFNDYGPSNPLLPVQVTGADREARRRDLTSGYSDLGLHSVIAPVDPAKPEVSKAFPRCVVDRVSLSDLTAEAFHSEYVAKNKPLIITTRAPLAAKDDVWALDSLVQKFGDVDILASAIPYATLFNRTENMSTLRDFVHGPGGLKDFTAKLQSGAVQISSKVNAAGELSEWFDLSLEEVTDILGSVSEEERRKNLPLYIFSGHSQKLNQKMAKDFMRTIAQYGEELGQAGVLLDLMDALSAKHIADINSPTKRSVGKKVPVAPVSWHFQFFLGPPLSGAPLHSHAPAFNFLQHGRKAWTLLPPGRDDYSRLHPLEWMAAGGVDSPGYYYRKDKDITFTVTSIDAATSINMQENEPDMVVDNRVDAEDAISNEHPCEVRQNAGDIVFVPRHWTHQVLNLAETVGFAVEIENYIY